MWQESIPLLPLRDSVVGININRRFSDMLPILVGRNHTYTSAHGISESEGTLRVLQSNSLKVSLAFV